MSRKMILMLSITILILAIIFMTAQEIVKPIVQIPESNNEYFVVVYGGDKWLKISEEKNEGFLNKIYNPCLLGVIVPIGEDIRVIKPERWTSLKKRESITIGRKIDFYTNGEIDLDQFQIDSLSVAVIQSCGK